MYDPFASSAYEYSPDYKSFYNFESNNYDYILGEIGTISEKREVNAVSLDHVIEIEDLVPPYFLSIDTEGSEYDVLLGSEETIKSNVVALVLETQFNPVFKEQKLFGEISKLLHEWGFYLVNFNLHSGASPFRGCIGTRAEGFQLTGDAFFLRRIDNLRTISDPVKRRIMLNKLAFISFIYNQCEYGQQCLIENTIPSDHSSADQNQMMYLNFLREIKAQLEKMPKVYPPTFSSKYPSFAHSQRRFQVLADEVERLDTVSLKFKIKMKLKGYPRLYSLIKTLNMTRYRLNNILFQTYCFVLRPFISYTEFEKIYVKYGLISHANVLKKTRFMQTKQIARRN